MLRLGQRDPSSVGFADTFSRKGRRTKTPLMTNDIPILSAPPPEHWDESFAQGLVGKTMLVNLTFLDADGELEGREAF